MDRKQLDNEIYEACLEAATQLGERAKGMSCFVNNWPHQAEVQEEKAAA